MNERLITNVKDVAAIGSVISFYMFAVFGCLFFAH